MALIALLERAFGVRSSQISGPTWIYWGQSALKFDLIASIPAGGSPEDIPAMLQSLLSERFNLTFHRETKDLSAYELRIANTGPKLKESLNTQVSMLRAGVPPPGLVLQVPRDGGFRIQGTAVSLSPGFTSLIEHQLAGTPVVDKTGLVGKYDIDIEFSSNDVTRQSEFALPSLSTVLLHDLGLRLVKKVEAVDTIVIDHLDKKPTEN